MDYNSDSAAHFQKGHQTSVRHESDWNPHNTQLPQETQS